MALLKKVSLSSVITCAFIFSAVTLQAAEVEKAQTIEVSAQLHLENNGIPWGMAWLPQGDMLMTLRGGELKRLNRGETKAQSISGLPKIAAGGQGGLLDIAVHPDYARNGWIYFSYTKADEHDNKSTAIMRAKLNGNQLTEHQHIYIAQAYDDSGKHFGSRLAFDNQGYLYFSIGDRGERDINPQDITRDAGKIYRLHDDGRIPDDNPFVDDEQAKKAIYSFGHRNPQGMIKHPVTGDIWTHEHGPRGGDEVNLIRKGENYGWPLVSYGINYWGTSFTDLTEKEGMEGPLWYWDPSIAPSGMAFVSSDKYPHWQGNILVGSLKFGQLVMLTLQGDKVVQADVVKEQLTRVRNVKQGPDGYLYIAIDGKGIYKLVPETSGR